MTRPGAAEQTQRMRAAFDTIAANYEVLRFVHVCARRLLELAPLRPGMRVLDMATGTGLVAFAAAGIVGPNGSVVGVDLSPEMLAQARQKLAPSVSNILFREGDAQHLKFPDQSFDAVLCASSLFFVPDMLQAVREWQRVLAPGGFVGFTSFGQHFLQPLNDMLVQKLHRHGVPIRPLPTLRLAEPATCEQLLRDAGFSQIEVTSEQLGYFVSAEKRWAEIEVGLEGMALARFTPEQRAQIKAEYLAEVVPLQTLQGIWVDVSANFAFGVR